MYGIIVSAYMQTIGLETDFSRLGITQQKDIELILDSVNTERLRNHPVHLTRTVLAQVFE